MDNTKDTPMDYKQFEGHTPGKRCKMNGEEIYICHIIEGNEALDYEGKCYGCGATRAILFDKENQTEADAARAYLIREGLDPDQLVKEGLVFIKTVQENVSLKSELQKQKEEIEQLRAVIEKLLLSAGYALHESLIDEAKKLIYK